MFGLIDSWNQRARMGRALPVLALLLALAGLIIPAQPASATTASTTGPSLRLLSYNTAFMSFTLKFPPPWGDTTFEPNDGKFYDTSYVERAAIIAERIKSADPDIVVINEVFSASARQELVNQLHLKYPHYIKRIDADPIKKATAHDLIEMGLDISLPPDPMTEWSAAYPNGSGLMLFSKYPFLPFSSNASPPYEASVVEGWNGAAGYWSGPGRVAFERYNTCEEMDCFASKGVGMVRIQGLTRVYNVAFTHMQAWQSPANVAARDEQFKQIKHLMIKSLLANELTTQPVYLAGDLNVHGQNEPSATPFSEWTTQFNGSNNSSGGFFACGDSACTFNPSMLAGTYMSEAWGFETSPDDQPSTSDEFARLDYILHSKPSRQCMQHIRIAYELGHVGGTQQYSDHMGVLADFNDIAPRCSADNDAGLLGPEPLDFSASPDIDHNGIFPAAGDTDDANTRLRAPGNVQWYYIDQAGSYTINIAGDDDSNGVEDVRYVVYHHSDLSRPIWNYKVDDGWYADCGNDCGDRFSLPDPPYYIKAFGQDRKWFGKYRIHVHKHQGLSRDDYILLMANMAMPFAWPDSSFVPAENPLTRYWFGFSTGVAASGKRPDLTIRHEFAAPQGNPNFYDMIVVPDKQPDVDNNGNPVYDILANYNGAMLTNPNTNRQVQNFELPPLDSPGPQTDYFVLLSRDPFEFGVGQPSFVTFGTNLTYFRPLNLWARDAWDEVASSDQIELSAIFDKEDYQLQHPIYSHDFDNDELAGLAGVQALDGSYTEVLSLPIWEDGDEYMTPEPGVATTTPATISTSVNRWGMDANSEPTGSVVEEGNYIYNDAYIVDGDGDDASYWYELRYLQANVPFLKCNDPDRPNTAGCMPW